LSARHCACSIGRIQPQLQLFVENTVNDSHSWRSYFQSNSWGGVMTRLRISCKILILLVLVSSTHTFAQADADALFEAEKWAEAAVAYEARTVENPDDTTAWIRLAVSARKAGRYETALNALQIAEEQGFGVLQIGVDRVRISVLQGNIEEAMVGLSALVDGGFTALAFIRNDPTIGSMAGNEAFDQLTEGLEKNSIPMRERSIVRPIRFLDRRVASSRIRWTVCGQQCDHARTAWLLFKREMGQFQRRWRSQYQLRRQKKRRMGTDLERCKRHPDQYPRRSDG